jgi:5-methylcytosine-specific restriction endonuclease McrA
MPESFIIQVNEKEIKREREKARALRQTRWWKQRLARGLCHYCRRHLPPAELSMDHIVPIIRGGKTTTFFPWNGKRTFRIHLGKIRMDENSSKRLITEISCLR